MIIIDQEIDANLAKALERVKTESINSRCIYFNLKNGQPVPANLKEKVIKASSGHIALYNPYIYFCDDGDIFILSATLDSKKGKEFILDVASFLKKPVTQDWVDFIELPLNIHKLLVEVDSKLEKKRKIEEAKKQKIEQQQAEQKRQAILNSIKSLTNDIKQIRNNRKTPELMIIEDDSFSRKLVENVLQKKYQLTALGEATHALDTYTRIMPDLLFLDINLPDVTGHELLEKIITLDPDAYVIMLSGNSDRDNVMQAMSKGAKGFVAKPFSKEKLFQYIERCPTIRQEN